jgi:hypothetical protein
MEKSLNYLFFSLVREMKWKSCGAARLVRQIFRREYKKYFMMMNLIGRRCDKCVFTIQENLSFARFSLISSMAVSKH